jgi:hypothetical protein
MTASTAMRQLFSFVLVLTAALAHAQEWSGGLRVDIATGAYKSGNDFRLSNTAFSTNQPSSSDADKAQIGGFVRYDQPNWMAQAEVMTGGFGLSINSQVNGWGTIGRGAYGRQVGLTFTGGYKPAPWLRLQAGLSLHQLFYEQGSVATELAYWQQQRPGNDPRSQEIVQNNINAYTGWTTLYNAFKTTQLTGHYSIGVDLGGLMIDVRRTEGLTPILNGVTTPAGERVDARLNYGFTSLSIGYRFFPVKRFLAMKKNRTYQKLKAEIPFFRNEFHIGLGNQAEDINAGMIYEARYTRSFTRRFGLSNILSFSQRDAGRYSTYLTPTNGIVLAVMGRVLPIYTRRHQVGLSLGLQGAWQAPRLSGSFSQGGTSSGQPVYRYVDAQPARFKLDGQWQFDYQIAVTDRLPLGVWLRQGGYGAFYGIQCGYRF